MKKQTPCVIIPGFCQSKLNMVNDNGEIIKKIWPADFDTKSAAKTLLPAYIKTVITRKDCGFTDGINSIFRDILSPTSVRSDGEMKNNIIAATQNESLAQCRESIRRFAHKIAPIDEISENIGDENIYLFSYNFFSDPFTVAAELDNFISGITQKTGCKKVNLLPYSLGGPITLAYLDAFSFKNTVEKIFFLVPALNGSPLIADVMSKNVDKKQGYSILEFVFSKSVADTFRKVLFLTPWSTRYALLYKSLDTAIDTVLLNSPMMWALVPRERYDELSSLLLSDGQHDKIIEITKKYHDIQKRAEKILLNEKDKGCEISVCAGCGQRFIEMSLDAQTSTDRIVPLHSAVLGKKVLIGEENGDISPLLPDSTFIIKNLSHVTAATNEKVQHLACQAIKKETVGDIITLSL